MRNLRLALLLVAVLPGLLMASGCGALFLSDVAAYFSASRSAASSNPFASLLPGGALSSGALSGLSSMMGQASLSALRFNCFLSGAGMMLGLMLLSIGVHGLLVSQSRVVPDSGREGVF